MTLASALSALVVPLALAVLVALPFWFTERNAIVGNVIGAGVIFVSTLGFVAREYIIFFRQRQDCLGTRAGCDGLSAADGFTRFAIFGIIGMFDVAALFVMHAAFERRRANRGVERKWHS